MSFGVAVLGTGRIGGRYINVVKKTPGADPLKAQGSGRPISTTHRREVP